MQLIFTKSTPYCALIKPCYRRYLATCVIVHIQHTHSQSRTSRTSRTSRLPWPTCARSMSRITIHPFKHMSVGSSPIRIPMLIFPQCSERILIAKPYMKFTSEKSGIVTQAFFLVPLFLLPILLSESDNCSSLSTYKISRHGGPVKS
jgi:hypothetical protein